jgi:CRISPR/Cas system CMR-associated protein Cmr3 (group 5 of RAMP superfamily)
VHSKTKYVQNKNFWEVYCIKQTSQKVKGGDLEGGIQYETLENIGKRRKKRKNIANNNAINA